MKPDPILESLNEILAVTLDGANGFHVAAGASRDIRVKCYLTRAAAHCRASAEVIKDAILRFGGVSYNNGTVAGHLHRMFLRAWGWLPHSTDAQVLRECLRGEAYALHAYRGELQQPLPDEIFAMLQWQLQGVQEHCAELHRLLDMCAPAKATLHPVGAD